MKGRVLAVVTCLIVATQALAQTDPLPSWNDGPAKQAIVKFVEDPTTQGGPKFVPPPERIATFDQDGTLWVDGERLAMLVLHDDATREYAYGPAQGLPNSRVGTFTQVLYDQATKQGWVVISMKKDWKRIFSFEP